MKRFIILAGLISIGTYDQAAGFVGFAYCQESDYQLVDAKTVTVVTQRRTYSPKCLKVKVNTTVTLPGSSIHPLQAADNLNSVVNPFRSENYGHTSAQTHTLSTPGFYGYFCANHGDSDGNGMAGTIMVVP